MSGALGCCASLNKKTSSVGEAEIGQGGTSAWKMNAIDASTTVAIFFEIVNQHNQPIPQGQPLVMQFQTTYLHSSGQHRLRITTVARKCGATPPSPPTDRNSWAPTEGQLDVTMGFDQEASAVVLARQAVFKMESEDAIDVLRWLDRSLIRLVSKFGEYRKDDASSFRLSDKFSIFPQFVFHLRRSQFLHLFNSSPDESAFYRLFLQREGVSNSLLMIQPSILAYSFNAPPGPVLLDIASISPEKILLLDTFFQVVVWHGEKIASWRKQGYHEKPEYDNFRQLLQAPRADAEVISRL